LNIRAAPGKTRGLFFSSVAPGFVVGARHFRARHLNQSPGIVKGAVVMFDSGTPAGGVDKRGIRQPVVVVSLNHRL
jgi:hypothetical protein